MLGEVLLCFIRFVSLSTFSTPKPYKSQWPDQVEDVEEKKNNGRGQHTFQQPLTLQVYQPDENDIDDDRGKDKNDIPHDQAMKDSVPSSRLAITVAHNRNIFHTGANMTSVTPVKHAK